MAENVEKGAGTGPDPAGSQTVAATPGGFRQSRAYNVVLGVMVLCMALVVLFILRSQFSRPDGRELLALTQKRVEKQVTKYLAKKVIKVEGREIPPDLAFKTSTVRFKPPTLETAATLPEVIDFEMDLITTGAEDGKQGKVVGFFSKNTGEMMINYDLVYIQDAVPSAYMAWEEDVMTVE